VSSRHCEKETMSLARLISFPNTVILQDRIADLILVCAESSQ